MTASHQARLLRVKSDERIPLTGATLKIGRDRSCDLRVNHRHASRLHAEIRREGDAYVLYDFSANGTFVNGERVRERRTLKPADTIRVAAERWLFLVGPEAAREPEPEVSPTAGTVPVDVVPATPLEGIDRVDAGRRSVLRRSREALPGWAYVAAVIVLAVLAFVFGLLLV